MKKIIYTLLAGTMLLATACYDDFERDNAFSAVYFPFQKPIRTVSTESPSFELGITLGGKRANNVNEVVQVSFAPNLLEDATKSVLPSSYFTMEFDSDSSITIPEGKFNGTVKVNLTDAFFEDPMAVTDHYIIPLKIVSFSADSALSTKDFTLTAVKYINRFQGWYYRMGADEADNGTPPFVYEQPDLVKNVSSRLMTSSKNSLIYSNLGKADGELELTIAEDNSVSFQLVSGADAISNASGTYDPVDKTFALNYTYEIEGVLHTVTEKLLYRNTELVLEEW